MCFQLRFKDVSTTDTRRGATFLCLRVLIIRMRDQMFLLYSRFLKKTREDASTSLKFKIYPNNYDNIRMINIDKQWLSIAGQNLYLPLKMVRVLLENVHLFFCRNSIFSILSLEDTPFLRISKP